MSSFQLLDEFEMISDQFFDNQSFQVSTMDHHIPHYQLNLLSTPLLGLVGYHSFHLFDKHNRRFVASIGELGLCNMEEEANETVFHL